MNVLELAQDTVDGFVDSVELWVEDQDEDAGEFLEEMARYAFDEVPPVALLAVLDVGHSQWSDESEGGK